MLTPVDFKIEKISDGSYRVTRTDIPGDFHTHMLSKRMAKIVIHNVCNSKIPLNTSNYSLQSMLRLSDNVEYVDKIQVLLDVRKQKGAKQKYYRPS